VVAEYRGYGPSTGTPSFDHMLGDSYRALDEMRSVLSRLGQHRPGSGDGTLAGFGASHRACVLAGAGDSRAGGRERFRRHLALLEVLGIPAARFGITEAHGPQNRLKMARVSLPTLVLHAELDQIISIDQGEALFEACRDPGKIFIRVSDAGHNDIQMVAGARYFAGIRDLIARIRDRGDDYRWRRMRIATGI